MPQLLPFYFINNITFIIFLFVFLILFYTRIIFPYYSLYSFSRVIISV